MPLKSKEKILLMRVNNWWLSNKMYIMNRRLSPEDAGNYMVNVRNKFGEKANHVRLSMKARQLSNIRERVFSSIFVTDSF
jgi:hypothetical protein